MSCGQPKEMDIMNIRNSLRAATLACAACIWGNAAAAGQLADVQIYDRAQNRHLPVHWHAGRAYVAGNPGNEYQITLRNRAGGDLLAVVSVDGVNVVSGETASPEQGGYVLGGHAQYEIRGWRKSLSRTAAFYFTRLPDSYAARTGRAENAGVIGVAVFRRKPPVPPPSVGVLRERQDAADSAGAPAAKRSQAASEAERTGSRLDSAQMRPPAAEPGLGTGHGRREVSIVRQVEFERATSEPEETITIYYDSARNLVARGVIAAPPLARPEPRPFPGRFVPDPPRG
ncbi:MAG: hypothetical protein IT514_02095 [Burkholderiales bacterium]|nr:hypothetical protein [Burkholderiales bacterium]